MTILRDERRGPSAPDATRRFSRREFLRLFGAGIVVCFTVGDWATAESQESRTGTPADFNAYLRIGEDGRVTVFTGKIEMGQGVITSLAQMAAEELGVSLGSIDMVMGDTDRVPFDAGTWGSMSVRFFGPALRGAAAEARGVLLELAAETLKAPKAELAAADGAVFVKREPSRRVTFGALAHGRAIERHASAKPALHEPAAWSVMGESPLRGDGRAKVTGAAKYAGDLRLPGLLCARVLRPPAHGATMKSVDTSAAAAMAGVTVVNQDGIVAVLHADPELAGRALAAVKAEWDVPAATVDTDTIFDHLVKVAPEPRSSDAKGDLTAGAAAAATLFEHRYENGYGAHAPMEPHTSVARFEDGRLTVWASTQSPFGTHRQLTTTFGLPQESVRVVTPFVGGGFGGKSVGPQSVEAARLAKITGRPVQVMWTREEEFFLDALRPAGLVKVRSGIDRAGRLTLWDYHVWSAGTRSAEPLYDAPHQLVRAYGGWGRDAGAMHAFAVGPWRAPGANLNVFARESQFDLMAAAVKQDPLAFRLRNLSDARMRAVLEAATARYGWATRKRGAGVGHGLACGVDAGSYVALCAEVAVDRATGAVRVKRVVCAQDMGQVVNPLGATMQVEGCIAMGMGYALSEEYRFEGGRVLARNFDSYELPRFSVQPRVETVLVKNDALAPQGGGEPAIVAVGAAIANAIADACGARLFRMPMTPERVKRALAG